MKKSLTALLASACLMAPQAFAAEELEMNVSFPLALPILGTSADDFANSVNAISSDIKIKTFEPGKLVPALEALDAVSAGSVDMSYAVSGYWQGKISSASFFTAVPFGPEASEFMGWIYFDDGQRLWQKMYDDNGYNVVAMPCGMIAPETSGWFREEIKSLEDLNGLNMRFFGLGAQVMQKLGVSTSLLAGGDIMPALERGTIDATEFSFPRVDARLGFHKIAKFNYFPGWHQPASILELLINKDVYEGLSDQAKAQIDVACTANVMRSLAEGEATNYGAMIENTEQNGVTIKQWPPEMLDTFETTWNEVAAEMAAADPFFKEVWDDLQDYRANYSVWSDAIYLPRPR